MNNENILDEIILYWGLPRLSDDLIKISTSLSQSFKFKILFFSNRKYQIYSTNLGRLIVYRKKGWVLVKRKSLSWRYLINFDRKEDRLEIGKLCYLSSYGLITELSGLLRLHGAAVEKNRQAVLFLGRPGAGKSTLSLFYLQRSERKIFSDELCFYDGKMLTAAPLKIHNKAGHLTSIIESRQAHRSYLSKGYILYGPNNKIAVKRITFVEKLIHFAEILLGIGLHQMMAYHLSIFNFHLWLRVLFIRILRALQLFSKVIFKKLFVPICSPI